MPQIPSSSCSRVFSSSSEHTTDSGAAGVGGSSRRGSVEIQQILEATHEREKGRKGSIIGGGGGPLKIFRRRESK